MRVSDLKEGYLYKDYDKRGWCKNGTFTVKLESNGVRVCDTYWHSSEYTIATDEYVKDFEEVLKLEDYVRVNGWSSIKDYSEEDYIQIHFSQCSGRFTDKTDFFLRKDAKKNSEKVKERLEYHIKDLERRLINSKTDLKRLNDGEISPDQVFIF